MDKLSDYLPVMDEKREEKIYISFGKWWFGDDHQYPSENKESEKNVK